MATKRIDLPDDNWAVITNDPLQKKHKRVIAVQVMALPNEDKAGNQLPRTPEQAAAFSDLQDVSVVAYTDSWSLQDDQGPIPIVETEVSERVRKSVIELLFTAIDDFVAETSAKVPNARTPRPKR